ncbi:hypothetical protein [Glutamicibacter sp. AOP5-A2-18]|uniref:hypothetical protein n=1 Tax=Glutamicibacter sp. AOP5-A2-18 TaxID=3457656 RepID=UPI004034AF4F
MSQELDITELRETVEAAGEAWADGEHIDIVTPATVLALLSRVEKAERSCRLLGTIIERDGKNLVELTNSQDIIPEDGDGDWEVVWERAQEMKDRLEQAEQAVARVHALNNELSWSPNNVAIVQRYRDALDGEPNE